jgi:hypothetical protein
MGAAMKKRCIVVALRAGLFALVDCTRDLSASDAARAIPQVA